MCIAWKKLKLYAGEKKQQTHNNNSNKKPIKEICDLIFILKGPKPWLQVCILGYINMNLGSFQALPKRTPKCLKIRFSCNMLTSFMLLLSSAEIYTCVYIYIYQWGAYKMSAFDDCSDYKSNASSIDCQDVALHGLCMLFYNVWYEGSATFHHGRTPLQPGKMMS